MKKQTLLLLILAIFLGYPSAFSQSVVLNDNSKQAYKAIHSLQLQTVESILEKEEKLNNNTFVPYLRNYKNFITLFVTQNRALYKDLKVQRSDNFQQVETLSNDSPYRNWMLGNMYLQWAVLKIIFGDYVAAAFDFNTAYNLIEENTREYPEFYLNNLSSAIFKIIIGLVPDQYKWFINILSMEGDVEDGKAQLQSFLMRCKTDTAYAPYYSEALFYAAFIEMNIYPDGNKLNNYIKEANQVDDSVLLITFLRINLYMRTGENQNALNLLKIIHSRKENALPFMYLHYLYAECLLRAQNWHDAISSYDLFLHQFKGENYEKDAWRKKAWAALMIEDTVLFYKCMDQVLKQGVDRIGIDKDALAEATKVKIPDKQLLLSQILFDGGYYADAVYLLRSMDTTTFSREERVAYDYRFARVYHRMEAIDKAKKYYGLTILRGKNLDSYYAANAALKLGEIYESEGELILAREAYLTCTDLNYRQYRNSISHRAKEGLKRLTKRR